LASARAPSHSEVVLDNTLAVLRFVGKDKAALPDRRTSHGHRSRAEFFAHVGKRWDPGEGNGSATRSMTSNVNWPAPRAVTTSRPRSQGASV
jgi:hypothetical protein